MSEFRVSVIGLLMLCSVAAAQVPSPDNMEYLVPGNEATGNLTLGCCTWDPVNEVFLTGTFGSSREFRRIDMKTNPPTVTVLALTSDGTSFALASNIPGGVTRWLRVLMRLVALILLCTGIDILWSGLSELVLTS